MIALTTDRRVLASIAVALSGCLWGAFWIPMRELANAGVDGAWATLAFFLPMSALLVPIAVVRRRAIRAALGELALTGALVGGAFCLYATGLLLGDVVRVVLLFYLTPVWGTLLAWLVLGHTITGGRAIALAAGLVGLLVILGSETGQPVPRGSGDWMGLIAGLAWAAGTLVIHRREEPAPTDVVVAFCMGGTVFAGLALLLPIEGSAAIPSLETLRAAWVWIAVLALVFTLPTMWLILWAAHYLDPGRVGLLLLSEVVVAVVSAAALTTEAFGYREAVGAALIVAAGFIEVLTAPRRAIAG